MTANLQPVLNARSTPNICLPLVGDCSNRFLKFSLKTFITSFSASVKSAWISRSIQRTLDDFKLSLIASQILTAIYVL